MAGAIFLSGLWMVGIFGTVPYSPKLSHREVGVVGWCMVLMLTDYDRKLDLSFRRGDWIRNIPVNNYMLTVCESSGD